MPPQLKYSALEKLKIARPVDRLELLTSLAAGKVVWDLGALDETAYSAKQTSANWLHARLTLVAAEVVGVDNSRLIPASGLKTADNGKIIHGDIHRIDDLLKTESKPEIIIAGELIEHLPHAVAFLASLKSTSSLRGVKLVITTPNACCWHNAVLGLFSRESMHRDHLQIYSYKTLVTTFQRAGYNIYHIRPYHARFPEMISNTTGTPRLMVRAFQRAINISERLCPALSGGWVVETEI